MPRAQAKNNSDVQTWEFTPSDFKTYLKHTKDQIIQKNEPATNSPFVDFEDDNVVVIDHSSLTRAASKAQKGQAN